MANPIKSTELMMLNIDGRKGKIRISFTLDQKLKYDDGNEYSAGSQIITKNLEDIAMVTAEVDGQTVTPLGLLQGLRAVGKELMKIQAQEQLENAQAALTAIQEAQALVEELDPSMGGELDLPSGDAPSGDSPSGDAPSGDLPSGDTPTGDLPSGDLPTGDAPSGDLPSGV